jgi:hypothetical protein
MYNVKDQANQNAALPITVDFMTERYVTDTDIFTFPSPGIWTIEKNMFYLIRNSTKKPFESQYIMRPDYLCIDEYGNGTDSQFAVLAPLIMRVNNVFSYEDFNLNEVIVPDFSAIVEMLGDKFGHKDPEDLVSVNW